MSTVRENMLTIFVELEMTWSKNEVLKLYLGLDI